VEVATPAPVATQQEQTFVAHALVVGPLGFDLLALLAPNRVLAVVLAELLPLAVCLEIHPDAQHSQGDDAIHVVCSERLRVFDKPECSARLEGRHPDKTPPTQLVSRKVVRYVHCAHIAAFPVEKFGDVNELQND